MGLGLAPKLRIRTLVHALLGASLALVPPAQGVDSGDPGSAAAISPLERQLKELRGAARIPVLVRLARTSRQRPSQVIEWADEAIRLLAEHPQPEHEAAARSLRSWALQTTDNYQASYDEASRVLRLAERVGDAKHTAHAHYLLAVAQWRMAKIDRALEAAEEARRIQTDQEDREALATTLTLFGAIYRSRSRLEKALEYHLQALKISEERTDQRAIARSHNNIGLIYWGLERHEDALASLTQALQVHRLLPPSNAIGKVLSNVGLILIELDRPTEALERLDEAFTIHQQAGNRHGLSKVLGNMAFAHEQLGNDTLALELNQRSLDLRLEIGDKHGIVRARGSIGAIHQRRGDHETAIRLIQDALNLAETIGARSEQASLLEKLSRSHEALGEPARALANHRRFHELHAELTDTAAQKRIADLERARADDRREHALGHLEQIAKQRQSEIERQQVWQQLLIIGSLLLAACVVLLGVLHALRVRALRTARESNAQLERTTAHLAESEQRYRRMFESSAQATLLLETTTRRVIDLNAPARKLCGPLPKNGSLELDEIEPQWVRMALSRMLDQCQKDDVVADDCWIERTGQLRWTEIRGGSVSVQGRECRLVSIRDTTELRAHEESRRRADKLESLGQLAGGIAHDFNNALTAIVGHISLAKDGPSNNAPEYLDQAEQAALHAGQLTSQLLAFAKGGEPIRRPRNVGDLLRDSVRLAGAGSSLRIDLDIDPELSPAAIDSGQFGQIVSNLILNAQQATTENGQLRIRATNFHGCLDLAEGDAPTDYIRIEFTDNGSGVAADVRERVFDPYFTTKPRGNGLGLATSFAIARHHQGTLTLTSREGHGATFTLLLPATDQPVAADGVPPPSTPDGGASILVLEDQPTVQAVFRRMLERWGYSVTLTADGASTVSRYLASLRAGKPFDLLIMDLTIPGGMGGKEALTAIFADDPTARAIVASGYSEDPTMAHFREAGFLAALKKPFHKDDLARVVSEALAYQPRV